MNYNILALTMLGAFSLSGLDVNPSVSVSWANGNPTASAQIFTPDDKNAVAQHGNEYTKALLHIALEEKAHEAIKATVSNKTIASSPELPLVGKVNVTYQDLAIHALKAAVIANQNRNLNGSALASQVGKDWLKDLAKDQVITLVRAKFLNSILNNVASSVQLPNAIQNNKIVTWVADKSVNYVLALGYDKLLKQVAK